MTWTDDLRQDIRYAARALGGMPSAVMHTIARQGMAWIAAGLLAGLTAGTLARAALQRLGYGVSPFEPATTMAVLVLLAAAGGLACYIPARQACRLDPVSALRT